MEANSYLQGFNDGYKKAMEQMGKDSTKIAIDGNFITGVLEPAITDAQERKKRIKGNFNAE
ncbi:hypothetical protein [Virgibacillus pantothenticus]|uniref:Uncharacterized protein n=1 Tax=Virgibacillus pantothenticus TaxID=1473 RepID=A0A0L0QV79_VIRPA|nr:hypothetical protein [Virgibacillus pantothenticus]KNE22484.1 hypothetical protein AFK71_02375 [Virgibacillus pantothenticus]MED3737262.1 hypothetical protein [Virgibacillus pantothenticus]QTY16954.1 hypothetical protein KBP50_03255 [Virgibacillus pantothenticus]